MSSQIQPAGKRKESRWFVTLAVGFSLISSAIFATVCVYSDSIFPQKKAKATAVALAGPKGDATHGKQLFNMSCFVCHGPTGAGVPGLGANLRESKFVAAKTDDALIAFIKVGRQPGDPNTVLNLTMPPKGGNPALDDKSLVDVVAFLRTLQAEAKASASAAQPGASASAR